jgi:prepilin-type N-terminal cleavage/methylation domain-containing protein
MTRTSGQSGFTLIEVMISSVLSAMLVAAAFSFVGMSMKQAGISTDHLAMATEGQNAMGLLLDDLRRAGTGVGYTTAGDFAGLMMGNFTVDGVQFNPDSGEATLALKHGDLTGAMTAVDHAVPSEDLGIRMATGSLSTLAQYDSGGTAQFCTAPGVEFEDGEVAVIRDESGLSARTILITSAPSSAACSWGECIGGCESFSYSEFPEGFASSNDAASPNYAGGELFGRFGTFVWFVLADGEGRANMRRAVFDNDNGCVGRDQNCGQLVARDVETLQYEVWRWDADSAAWARHDDGSSAVTGTDRIRIDVELVVRSDRGRAAPAASLPLRLRDGTCVPDVSPCGSPVDYIERAAYRTSIEIKNAGRMQLKFFKEAS